MSDKPMSSTERAEALCKKAESLGLCHPTEGMISDAIQCAELNALHNPAAVAFHNHDQELELMRGVWADALREANDRYIEHLNETP